MESLRLCFQHLVLNPHLRETNKSSSERNCPSSRKGQRWHALKCPKVKWERCVCACGQTGEVQVKVSGEHKSVRSDVLNVTRQAVRSRRVTFLPSPLQASCPSVSSNWKPEPKPRPLQSTRRKKEESGSDGMSTSRTDVCIPAEIHKTTHSWRTTWLIHWLFLTQRNLDGLKMDENN